MIAVQTGRPQARFRPLVGLSRFLAGFLLLGIASSSAPARGACFEAPAGMVGWWSGDGTANTLVGTNNGVLQGGASATAAGLVASAFGLDGTNGYVQVPDSPSLRPTNLTVEAWVRFSSLDSAGSGGSPAGDQYLVFRQNSRDSDFEGFSVSKTRIAGGDVFSFLVSSAAGQPLEIQSATTIATGVWYHVACVRGTNFLQLYVNGQLENQASVTFPQDYGNHPLLFGSSGQNYWDHKLKGTLDEVSLYNRALSPGEISSIFGAGAAGKCKAPAFVTQPQNQTVIAGTSATFTVTASGMPTLAYQWQFNGSNLPGATNTSFSLASVQATNAGGYAAIVTNSLGSVTSSVATLNVLIPPVVAAPPQNRTNIVGTAASFSATVTGSPPITYRWRTNGIGLSDGGRISGAASNVLTIANVQLTDVADYTLFASNFAGSVTSAVASLTVLVPPTITVPPADQSVVAGSNATFTVGATGSLPLSYQWRFYGSNLAGATGTALRLTNVQPADAGGYAVVVTNVAGAVTSSVATLAVWVPPVIIGPPQSRTNVAGTTASFSAAAEGSAPLGYRWLFNGVGLFDDGRIAGAASASLSIATVQPVDAGSYRLVVSNVAGMATSAVASLTVTVPPTITVPPASRTVAAGSNVTFNVSATGAPPLAYQWRKDGTPLSGATTTALELPGVQPPDSGSYDVVVTNLGGAVTSAPAVLAVWAPPAIVTQPQGRTNVAGTTASFSTVISGTTPFQYRWQFNSADLNENGHVVGASSNLLSIIAVQPGDAGPYRLIVSNFAGTVTSAVAWLTVIVPPAVTVPPASQTVLVGSNALFSIEATGTLPLAYQWQFNGAIIDGATGTSLARIDAQLEDAGSYRVVITNQGGAITSPPAVLTVWMRPVITSQPQSRTNVSGTTATFSATVIGTLPLSCQWRLNEGPLADGGRIAGATSTALAIANTQPGDAGNYTVVASNIAGAVTSVVASLAVVVAPAITVPPAGLSALAGTNVSFSVTATGTLPLAYQWQFNGLDLGGATQSTLALPGIGETNAGSYRVVVTNIAGAVTSAPASLVVLAPPAILSQPVSQSVPAGTNVVLSVTASGTGPLHYQWLFNGNALTDGGQFSGVSSPSLVLEQVWPFNSGTFTVAVTNLYGAVTSSPAIMNIMAAAQCVPPPAGLMGWWPGDGSANDWAGTNHGFLQGGAAANAVAPVNSGFILDGTNAYVRIPHSAAFNLATLSLEAWVRFDSLDSAGNTAAGQQYIVFKQNSRNTEFEGFALTKERGVSGDFFLWKVVSAAGQSATVASTTLIRTGLWYHVTGVRGANVLQLFVNGRLENQAAVGFAQDYGSFPLFFGTSGQSYWDHKFAGALDEVCLYDRALAADEIEALYGSGSAGKCKAPRLLSIGLYTGYPGLTLSGVAGQLYHIQTNTNLADPGGWKEVTNLVLGTPTQVWFDPQPATQPQLYYRLLSELTAPLPSPWETSDIGAVWSDGFDRAALGSNWVLLADVNATIVSNQLRFLHTNQNAARQMYYLPWLTCSDQWTVRWMQRFETLNATSSGVGVGLKNFQDAGGDDRGYNAMLSGAGADFGRMKIQMFNGFGQVTITNGSPMALAAGDTVDCWLTRSGWTLTATAINRANSQVSTVSLVFSDAVGLDAPTISRICFYPSGGTVSFDDLSFTINHRKPARFVVAGDSISDGYNASSYEQHYVSVVQSNFTEAVCNDSSSYNTTTNLVSVLPEILAHKPGTAVLMIGGNDLQFGHPPMDWQFNYSNLVATLQANGIRVKHCLPTPRTTVNLLWLKDWIQTNYPPSDVIDTWTPLLDGTSRLKAVYDSGDGTHPNDAGHLIMGLIIRTNLP